MPDTHTQIHLNSLRFWFFISTIDAFHGREGNLIWMYTLFLIWKKKRLKLVLLVEEKNKMKKLQQNRVEE